MLLIGFSKINKADFANKYKDKVVEIDYNQYQEDWPIQVLEYIKQCINKFEVVVLTYKTDIILCLDTLNIDYTLIYPETCESEDIDEYNWFNNSNKDKIILDENETIEKALSEKYDWINIEEVVQEPNIVPINKNKLSLSELLDENMEITEADVRDLKATQNKLKVGMLLQAKNSLNRVLKLSDILDKLYDKLLDRIENSLDTTDTASLMYTTEYISKALSDTNQFIISMINNEKIQNFFIIDNSSVINVNDDSVLNINSREKVRKAVEVVLDNIDYFEQGDFQKMKDPNIIEGSDLNADKSTKSSSV